MNTISVFFPAGDLIEKISHPLAQRQGRLQKGSHFLLSSYIYYYTVAGSQCQVNSALICTYLRGRSHEKVLFISECRTYVLVQVFHSLSRRLFSLQFLSLGRLGVVASVLEFLIEALLDDYVLELGHGSFHTVIGFHFNRYHCAPVCSVY